MRYITHCFPLSFLASVCSSCSFYQMELQRSNARYPEGNFRENELLDSLIGLPPPLYTQFWSSIYMLEVLRTINRVSSGFILTGHRVPSFRSLATHYARVGRVVLREKITDLGVMHPCVMPKLDNLNSDYFKPQGLTNGQWKKSWSLHPANNSTYDFSCCTQPWFSQLQEIWECTTHK